VFLSSHHQQWFFIIIWASICADNYLDPTYFQTRLESELQVFCENSTSDFLTDMTLIIRPELTSCTMALPRI
jgi:hypothetical protein